MRVQTTPAVDNFHKMHPRRPCGRKLVKSEQYYEN
jgi:hypothetical protein